jgi:hypothetical protein
MNKGASKNFNLGISQINNINNHIIAEVEATNLPRLPYFLTQGQTLRVTEGSKLRKIQCLGSKTRKSGSIFPTVSNVVKQFKNQPAKLAKALSKLFKKNARQATKLLISGGIAANSVANGVASAFGKTASVWSRGSSKPALTPMAPRGPPNAPRAPAGPARLRLAEDGRLSRDAGGQGSQERLQCQPKPG